MLNKLLFPAAAPGFPDGDAILSYFQQFACLQNAVFCSHFHIPAYILNILAAQFQWFIQTRRRQFQGKIIRRKQSALYNPLIQGPVISNAFVYRYACVGIQEHFNIIGGFDPDFHQETFLVRLQKTGHHFLYSLDGRPFGHIW